MSRQQYHILYSKIAKPVFNMAMMYQASALFVENRLVNPKVVKAFDELKKALEQQLKSIER